MDIIGLERSSRIQVHSPLRLVLASQRHTSVLLAGERKSMRFTEGLRALNW